MIATVVMTLWAVFLGLVIGKKDRLASQIRQLLVHRYLILGEKPRFARVGGFHDRQQAVVVISSRQFPDYNGGWPLLSPLNIMLDWAVDVQVSIDKERIILLSIPQTELPGFAESAMEALANMANREGKTLCTLAEKSAK